MTRSPTSRTARKRRAETDVLGAPYTVETIDLGEDEEGVVVASLVHRPPNPEADTGRAALYVHGFCDYFFQRDWGDWWAERGYAFYAVDLRKYGRSLLPHQTPNYVADLRDHFPELDAAWTRVSGRDGHAEVLLTAHSTGGLIAGLWANQRRLPLVGAVMNSPWLDLAGSFVVRTVGTTALRRLAQLRPRQVIPRGVSGLYVESIHRDFVGEWDFDLARKPALSWPVTAGWLRAVRDGHAEVHRGLDLGCPVLVLTSGRSTWPRAMGEDVHSTDIVLDVEQIRHWAPSLSRHVTIVGIEGARHDVILSRAEPRARAYAEIERWLTAYAGG